jgi:hypothetical protein
MTITLRPEQERVLMEAIHSGLANSPDEALDRALDALRVRVSQSQVDNSVAAAARRLGTFGKRHGLSLGGMTIQELVRKSRP